MLGNDARGPASNEVQHGQPPLKVPPRPFSEYGCLRGETNKIAADKYLYFTIAEQRQIGCPWRGLQTIECHL